MTHPNTCKPPAHQQARAFSAIQPAPDAAGIPCFTPGTSIATETGFRLIEDLVPGDRIFTRDHGLQAVRWIGQQHVLAEGATIPVEISLNVFHGMTAPLLVSQQHRMLFSGYRAQLLFGESEVLVPARDLIDGKAVTLKACTQVTYIHLMCDQHEVIYANGVPSESFHPTEATLKAASPAVRDEIFTEVPDLRTGLSRADIPARRCLRSAEAQMLQM